MHIPGTHTHALFFFPAKACQSMTSLWGRKDPHNYRRTVQDVKTVHPYAYCVGPPARTIQIHAVPTII
jgi:hypothetical protein